MTTKVRTAKNTPVNLIDYDENIDEVTITKWDLKSKLDPNVIYNGNFVECYENGCDFNSKTLEEKGFSIPMLFKNKDGLGLRLPEDNFTVDNVAVYVGKNRVLDVVDVETQNAIGMTMKDWCEYYKSPDKSQLLNVISLEFSQSRMDDIIKAPDIVLEMDWLENCWPQKCRDIHVDNKSYLKTLTYPKVRKYCLMSVGGCYTDFHIDLGGTSVWYHIFKGEKVFWIVPPTEKNLAIYEKWCLSSDQSSCFFPELVEECEKVHLEQGNTFMIPSGWIHGVYTPVDSLVFGGNFLHSYSIPLQLRVWNVEEKIKVNEKYRYPFFTEMHWYVLATLVGKISGKSYLTCTNKKNTTYCEQNETHTLNNYEIEGIQRICDWLKQSLLNPSKSIPSNIEDPGNLVSDAEDLCKSFLENNSYQFKSTINEIKAEQQNGQLFNNFDLYSNDNKKCMKLEIIPLPKAEMKITKSRKPKSKKIKLKITKSAEIPQALFNQIIQRTGSRQIVRPDRFIENPFQ